MSTGTQARRVPFFGYVAFIGAAFGLGLYLDKVSYTLGAILAGVALVISLIVTNNDARRAKVEKAHQKVGAAGSTIWRVLHFLPAAAGFSALYWLSSFEFRHLGVDWFAIKWTGLSVLFITLALTFLNPKSYFHLSSDEVGMLQFFKRVCFWAIVPGGDRAIPFGHLFKLVGVYKITDVTVAFTDEEAWTADKPDGEQTEYRPTKAIKPTGSVKVLVSGVARCAVHQNYLTALFRVGGPEQARQVLTVEIRSAINAAFRARQEDEAISGKFGTIEADIVRTVNIDDGAASKTGYIVRGFEIGHALLSPEVVDARQRAAVEGREMRVVSDKAKEYEPDAIDYVKKRWKTLTEDDPEFWAKVDERIQWYFDQERADDVVTGISKGDGAKIIDISGFLKAGLKPGKGGK